MARKRSKKANLDDLVKAFLDNYNVATRSDVDKILKRLDRLENQIRRSAAKKVPATKGKKKKAAAGKRGLKAFEKVFASIRKRRKGASVADIKKDTGFDDKKVRNLIFRLNKMAKIQRVGRGVYKVA